MSIVLTVLSRVLHSGICDEGGFIGTRRLTLHVVELSGRSRAIFAKNQLSENRPAGHLPIGFGDGRLPTLLRHEQLFNLKSTV